MKKKKNNFSTYRTALARLIKVKNWDWQSSNLCEFSLNHGILKIIFCLAMKGEQPEVFHEILPSIVFP